MRGADRQLEALLIGSGGTGARGESSSEMAQAEMVVLLVGFTGRNRYGVKPCPDVMRGMKPLLDPAIGAGQRDRNTYDGAPCGMARGGDDAGIDQRDQLRGAQRSVRQDVIPVNGKRFATA
jgi:hypothetical protein